MKPSLLYLFNKYFRIFIWIFYTIQTRQFALVIFADEKAFAFTTLLHTYLRVPDVTQTTVSGLKGLNYVDKVGVPTLINAFLTWV